MYVCLCAWGWVGVIKSERRSVCVCDSKKE
jgi:hypothetical protein